MNAAPAAGSDCGSRHAVQPTRSPMFAGDPGTWHVSPPAVLTIDSASGAALAKSSGTAMVFHDIPGIVNTYREVFPTALQGTDSTQSVVTH